MDNVLDVRREASPVGRFQAAFWRNVRAGQRVGAIPPAARMGRAPPRMGTNTKDPPGISSASIKT
jgi:hypothetical protein